MALHHKIHNVSKGYMSLEDYFQDFSSTYDELAIAEEHIEESTITFALLRGLGIEFAPFIAGLSACTYAITLEDAIAQVRSYDQILKF